MPRVCKLDDIVLNALQYVWMCGRSSGKPVLEQWHFHSPLNLASQLLTKLLEIGEVEYPNSMRHDACELWKPTVALVKT